jgi:hypothetical protein
MVGLIIQYNGGRMRKVAARPPRRTRCGLPRRRPNALGFPESTRLDEFNPLCNNRLDRVSKARYLLESGSRLIPVEIKVGQGGKTIDARRLQNAARDLDARATWIIDQATGAQNASRHMSRAGHGRKPRQSCGLTCSVKPRTQTIASMTVPCSSVRRSFRPWCR